MAKIALKEMSRKNFTTNDSFSDYPDLRHIEIGCLMRIADALELIAKNNQQLIEDYESMKRSRDWYRDERDKSDRKCAAFKGVITKMKKKTI